MIVRDLVLLGGGHSHLFVLKAFAMRPIRGLRLTLVSDVSHAAYSGMLPGLIAGHYDFDDAHVDLRALATFAQARFVRAEVVGLSANSRAVLLKDRPPLSYDLCSLNLGALPDMPPEVARWGRAVPAKPVPRLLRWLADFERRAGEGGRPATVAVLGAGAGGVELALALAHRFAGREAMSLSVIERAPDILPGFPPAARRAMRQALASAGVCLHTGATFCANAASVRLRSNREEREFDHVILATGVRPAPWLAESGLTLDPAGFVAVGADLRSRSHPTVFAAGDIASQVDRKRPKAGVFAVRQGPVLAENLRRLALGQGLKSYRPQSRYLALLSQGARRAIAVRNGMTLSGGWVWRWKDRIDRRFMRRFADLPIMQAGPLHPSAGKAKRSIAPEGGAAPAMRCAGCGAKVSGDVLACVLARLRGRPGAALVADRARRDDAHVVLPPKGHEIVQSIDYFPAPVGDPYLSGRIAAAHALSDLYAMGASPLFALANIVLPYASRDIQEEELFQILSGALDALEEDGAALAGGHSGEGESPGLGFAVTGHLPAGGAISKRGLRAGDALILTKPIGTGALFAAAMRRAARGRWIDAALRSMLRSNKTAAELLRRFGVTALSDVTGFGLGGHLAEMLAGSDLTARIAVAAIPVLEGLDEVLGAEIESTLAAANLRTVEGAIDSGPGDRGAIGLLSDPQTSGGLLAGVPARLADACVEALREGGHPDAAVIGFLARRRPGERPISLRGGDAATPHPAAIRAAG